MKIYLVLILAATVHQIHYLRFGPVRTAIRHNLVQFQIDEQNLK